MISYIVDYFPNFTCIVFMLIDFFMVVYFLQSLLSVLSDFSSAWRFLGFTIKIIHF